MVYMINWVYVYNREQENQQSDLHSVQVGCHAIRRKSLEGEYYSGIQIDRLVLTALTHCVYS